MTSIAATVPHATMPEAMGMGRRLALDAFQNSRVSVALGIFCAFLSAYAHAEMLPAQAVTGWMLMIIGSFLARLLLARVALGRLTAGGPYMALVNIEAVLAGLTGLGWSAAFWFFDSGEQDHLFYFRIILVVGATAFVVSSLTLYLRVFMAYTLCAVLPSAAMIALSSYLDVRDVLVATLLLFGLAVVIVGTITNRRTRAAVASQIESVRLSNELQGALESERRALAALSEAAVTDELTGVLNRRGIIAALDAEIARCKRFEHGLGLLVIDIDHFKKINDAHGHVCGDEALCVVVRALREMLRTTDSIGRFGGEEFLVLLPELDGEGARIAAERLREKVATSPVNFENVTLQPTISLGLALHSGDETGDRLIARADEALYAAKRNGRNRVELAAAPSA